VGAVVITGTGAVTPLGMNVRETWCGLRRGDSGLKPITLFDTAGLRNGSGGEIPGVPPGGGLPRSFRFLVQAAEEALAEGTVPPEARKHVGVSVGTNFGAVEEFARYVAERDTRPEEARARLARYPFECFLDVLRDRCGTEGMGTVVSTACSSGLAALDAGIQILENTDAEYVLCAAVDELTLFSYAGLNALRAITPEKIRPFTRSRKGTQFAEGAGAVIIEHEDHARSRGASILARVEAVFLNNDAFHTTAPDPEGRGITAVMEGVFEASEVPREAVTHVNAHGTGTVYNDKIETRALKNVFGEHAYRLYINAVKSMTGHAMGAAGMIELICTVMTLKTGVVPPTVNYDEPDEELDLNYCVNTAVKAAVSHAITNSYGIGGANGCALLSAPGAPREETPCS